MDERVKGRDVSAPALECAHTAGMLKEVDEAVAALRARRSARPEVGVILGSGLGRLAEEVQGDDGGAATSVSFREIPHFPGSTVPGHVGRLVLGKLDGREVAVMQGRSHLYEGWSLARATFPVRVLARLGVQSLLVTNSAGGASKEYRAGDLMVIEDHINLLGGSPLRGPNFEEFGPRFPDMSRAYDPDGIALAHRIAAEIGIPLKQGVYLATHGPQYETPAEIRMMRTLGADAVGMSTVPEVIVARHMGLRVTGISCITNMAAGISDTPLSHDEVMETSRRVQERFLALLRMLVGRMGR